MSEDGEDEARIELRKRREAVPGRVHDACPQVQNYSREAWPKRGERIPLVSTLAPTPHPPAVLYQAT